MTAYKLITVVCTLMLCAGCLRTGDVAADSHEDLAGKTPVPFLVQPYLQWGYTPDADKASSIQVLWHDDDHAADWSLEYRPSIDRPWQPTPTLSMRRIAVENVPPHRVYRGAIGGLQPGGDFSYRVRRDGVTVFESAGRAPKPTGAPFRFVVFGDCGVNTAAQKGVCFQAYQARPDFVMITGDIVYDRGRISEYRDKFWPIYNADEAAPERGAPLLRSTLFFAAPGNHDIATRDLGKFPDGLAYFLYWAQPLNGPITEEGAPRFPPATGPEPNKKAFLDAAGPSYPRMANFSFDYGDAHWTVLDANPYMDWGNSELRSWVERDLDSAKVATWHFVAMHQPGFNSARTHFDEQNMRRLSDVLEAGGVDLVFCGHVHNYQRTFPLRFVPENSERPKQGRRGEHVDGHWTLDKTFDGKTKTRPEGVIYLVSGGGGANLYNPEQQDDPATWQEFTDKFVSKVHSLTIVEVDGPRLRVRQVSVQGDELDRFNVTK
jgi:3',5'-cyclic AMP phosphodiesterase CpdA